jgi:hypothetical protein
MDLAKQEDAATETEDRTHPLHEKGDRAGAGFELTPTAPWTRASVAVGASAACVLKNEAEAVAFRDAHRSPLDVDLASAD